MSRNHFFYNIRYIELLAHLLNGEIITKQRAAELLNVEEITISRALRFYRSLGIEAFGRKSGIKIFNKPKKEDLIFLASNYISSKLSSDYFYKSIKTYSKIDAGFFNKIVLLSKAIKENIIIKVKYQRLTDNKTNEYTLKPYKLIESNNNWILHALKEDESILKTFYLSRMQHILLTEKKFRKDYLDDNLGEMEEVILKFVPEVERELYYKIWFDEFEIEKQSDGSIILKTNYPINNRLAAWCISWWDAIEIIKPVELKKYINEMYSDFIKKNN